MLHPLFGADGDCYGRSSRVILRGARPRADRTGDDPVEAGNTAFHLSEPFGICNDCEEIADFSGNNRVAVFITPSNSFIDKSLINKGIRIDDIASIDNHRMCLS